MSGASFGDFDDDAFDASDAEFYAAFEAAGLTLEEGAELVHGLMEAGLDPADPTWRTPLPGRED